MALLAYDKAWKRAFCYPPQPCKCANMALLACDEAWEQAFRYPFCNSILVRECGTVGLR